MCVRAPYARIARSMPGAQRPPAAFAACAGRRCSMDLLESRVSPDPWPMIELNPIRQRIVDLRGRLDALRGYL